MSDSLLGTPTSVSLTNVSWSGDGHSNVAGNIADTTLNLASGASVTYTVTGTLPSTTVIGTLSDSATVTVPSGITDSNSSNNTATTSTRVYERGDLQISDSDGATSPARRDGYLHGDRHQHRPELTRPARRHRHRPGRLHQRQLTPPAPPPANGLDVLQHREHQRHGEHASRQFDHLHDHRNGCQRRATGTLTNSASVTHGANSSDPNTSNNIASDSDTILTSTIADLQVTDVFGQTSYAAGTPGVTYTIVVTDAGPAMPAMRP